MPAKLGGGKGIFPSVPLHEVPRLWERRDDVAVAGAAGAPTGVQVVQVGEDDVVDVPGCQVQFAQFLLEAVAVQALVLPLLLVKLGASAVIHEDVDALGLDEERVDPPPHTMPPVRLHHGLPGFPGHLSKHGPAVNLHGAIGEEMDLEVLHTHVPPPSRSMPIGYKYPSH